MEVTTLKELKAAINSGAVEITSSAPEVVDKIRILIAIRKYGPAGVAAVVAAVPVILATLPVSGPATAALAFFGGSGGAVSASAIVALVVAIGGVVVISLLTDWDHVEINGVLKMSRKQK